MRLSVWIFGLLLATGQVVELSANEFHADIELALDGGVLITETLSLDFPAEHPASLLRQPIPEHHEEGISLELLYLQHNGIELNPSDWQLAQTEIPLLGKPAPRARAGRHRFLIRYYVEGALEEGLFSSRFHWSLGSLQGLGGPLKATLRITAPRLSPAGGIELLSPASSDHIAPDSVQMNRNQHINLGWQALEMNHDTAFSIELGNALFATGRRASERPWLRASRTWLWLPVMGLLLMLGLKRTGLAKKYRQGRTAQVALALFGLCILYAGGALSAEDFASFNWMFAAVTFLFAILISPGMWLSRGWLHKLRIFLTLALTLAVAAQLSANVSGWYPLLFALYTLVWTVLAGGSVRFRRPRRRLKRKRA